MGSVWICYFDAEILKKELELPDLLCWIYFIRKGRMQTVFMRRL